MTLQRTDTPRSHGRLVQRLPHFSFWTRHERE